MNQKLIFCIAFLLIICCDAGVSSAAVENSVSDFDKINKTLTIYDNESKVMTVRLISAVPDIGTFTEIFEVSNFEAYTPDSKSDFTARTNTKVGIGDVIGIEWSIEQNVSYVVSVTDYGIKEVEEIIFNNKTGKNETILVNRTVITGYHDEIRYRDVWDDYQPYDKEMKAGSVQRIKVVYHKIPELGPFQIQTVPMFRGVECSELTWWSGLWDQRRAILINNIGGDSVTDYQLKSVNLSSYNINASSARIINSTSNLQESFWNESVDASGNLEYAWCNYSELQSGSWINSTYKIYYQSISSDNSVSDGDATFIFFDVFAGITIDPAKWDIIGSATQNDKLILDATNAEVKSDNTFGDNLILEYTSDINTGNKIFGGFYKDALYNAREWTWDGSRYLTRTYENGVLESNEYAPGRTPGLKSNKIERYNNGTYKFYYTGVTTYTHSTHTPDNTQLMHIYFRASTYSTGHNYIYTMRLRKYTTNEPEPWTVGAEEEYSTPTPTPTPAPTTSVSPAQYDELDLSLILYILMISMLYLLIVFRHGVAAVELSFIYLIFAFFFLLFQTVTMSVNYIYLTLFLLLFMISIAGITLEKRSW